MYCYKIRTVFLATSVYYKEAAEPYIVPFKSDHPRHVFNNIIDGASMRAVRLSSTLSAFDEEQRAIKLILLYNGYPPRYVYNRFMKFITNNLRISSILPLFESEHNFTFVRSYLLNKPTVTEQQIASRIAKTIGSMNHDQADDPLVRIQLKRQSKSMNNLIIHYVHEARLISYKKDIHELWHQIFQETLVMKPNLLSAIAIVQTQLEHLYDSLHIKNYHTKQLMLRNQSKPTTYPSTIENNMKLLQNLYFICKINSLPNKIIRSFNTIALLNP